MSDWGLNKVPPPVSARLQRSFEAFSVADKPGYVLAEIDEFLTELCASEFALAVSEKPQVPLNSYWEKYVAATVEQAPASKRAEVPAWTKDVDPLEHPVFRTVSVETTPRAQRTPRRRFGGVIREGADVAPAGRIRQIAIDRWLRERC